MKKLFYLPVVAAYAVMFAACSDDNDDPKVPELQQSYFTIEGATFQEAAFPVSTIAEQLQGVDMSEQVMNGAVNYVTVMTQQDVDKFFIGVDGVQGYYEYKPATDENASSGYNAYVIPVMMSESYQGNTVMKISGKLANGEVTNAVTKEIRRIETKTGAIEVKMAFSNDKDIDLHLYTPSGKHIYYGSRGGSLTLADGSVVDFGLDIDSNAGCHIDGVDKENIVIPQQLVENGEYRVEINMYSNCQPSLPTSWSIITRYKGQVITPTEGHNPASGVYSAYAPDGDHTVVMTFKITDGHDDVVWPTFDSSSSRPTKATEAVLWKIKRDFEMLDF